MSSFVITCPNPTCGKPLNLPAAAVGQPLSCPHCGTGIAVTLGPDGKPTAPAAVPTRRVPKMFLVPGFALLILGAAGVFANGYVAADALLRPGADRDHARRMVDDLRNVQGMSKPANEAKGKQETGPLDEFGAVAGGVAVAAAQEQGDETLAAAWTSWVGPFNAAFVLVSLLMVAGGVAILRGRWFWLAMVGCVAALLNFNNCCCVPGLVAGLWGILTLSRDDGRRHFAR